MGDRQSSKPLIDAVDGLAKESFDRLGFKRREEGLFTLELNPEFIGVLGLGRRVGRGEGWLDISPSVGVRHQVLERNLAELLGQRWHSYAPATISTNLGYLSAQRTFLSWSFSIEKDPAPTVEEMTRSLEALGIPFMKSNASLDALTDRLSSFDFTTADSQSYRLPLALLLKGDKDRALALIDKELLSLEGRKGAGADFYRKYAKNFRELAQRE